MAIFAFVADSKVGSAMVPAASTTVRTALVVLAANADCVAFEASYRKYDAVNVSPLTDCGAHTKPCCDALKLHALGTIDGAAAVPGMPTRLVAPTYVLMSASDSAFTVAARSS